MFFLLGIEDFDFQRTVRLQNEPASMRLRLSANIFAAHELQATENDRACGASGLGRYFQLLTLEFQ